MPVYKSPDGTLEHVIKVRISDAQLKSWSEAARVDHRSFADWIRMRCDGLPTTAPVPFTGSTPIRDAVNNARAIKLGAKSKQKKGGK